LATTTSKTSNEPSLTEDDWRLVLQGASCLTVIRNEYVIKEGEENQRIYQIVEGKCRIEKKMQDNPQGGGGGGGGVQVSLFSFLSLISFYSYSPPLYTAPQYGIHMRTLLKE
jgi:hypothetical protein